MDQKVSEKEGVLFCVRHNKKIKMMILDNSIPFCDTLCCSLCLDEKLPSSKKIVSIKQAPLLIEKCNKLDASKDSNRRKQLNKLQIFSENMMDTRSQCLQSSDEILRIIKDWTTELTNLGKKPEYSNRIQELEQFFQSMSKVKKPEEDQIQKSSTTYLEKINLDFQKLMGFDQIIKSLASLKKSALGEVESEDDQKKSEDPQKSGSEDYKKEASTPSEKINKYSSSNSESEKDEGIQPTKNYEFIHSVKQKEWSRAIAFNNSRSVMAAACDKDIKMWSFEGGNLVEQKRLRGHTDVVSCIVFSKKFNWFASGGCDNTIRCWKEVADNDWVSSQPGEQHTHYVMCLVLNKNENQLISCSYDKTIKVWNVDYEQNQIICEYTLEDKHTNWICCISMNESETALVSCSFDKQIILWAKGLDEQWHYQNHIVKDDYGMRLCFIGDNQIAWQQKNKGYTHFFEIKNQNLIEKPELKIILKDGDDDDSRFPTIFNNSKQILILKFNRYVYIMSRQSNGQFKIESEPIDCKCHNNFGALTENGEYLVIWSYETGEFRIYRINIDQ